MSTVTPKQFKMVNNAVYVGFPMPVVNGRFALFAGCSISMNTKTGAYDIRAVMDGNNYVDVNPDNVMTEQFLDPTYPMSSVYCRYLGAWIEGMADMTDGQFIVPPYIIEYIEESDEEFKKENSGVSILLAGAHAYWESVDVKTAKGIMDEIQQVISAYDRKLKTTPQKESTCSTNVVRLNFGSNRNASEEESKD